jgi:hypothetical protein
MPKKTTDPYASPPLKHDRIGPLVRFVVIAALVAGAGAVAYEVIQTPAQAPLQAQTAVQQQLAGGRYSAREATALPATAPAATPAPAAAPTPTPAPAATPSRHRAQTGSTTDSAPTAQPAGAASQSTSG